ncbi:MAG: DNA-binding transcriptional regulator Fis [Pseudohongiellaceae bacterium]|jgi:Fis family transcriptional regulator
MSNFLNESANFQPGKATAIESPELDERSTKQQTLRECVTSSLSEYFNKVDHDNISNLYDLVLSEVEAPLLQTVMQHTRSNQSKASAMLGLNRGTLRKKLKKYGMLN